MSSNEPVTTTAGESARSIVTRAGGATGGWLVALSGACGLAIALTPNPSTLLAQLVHYSAVMFAGLAAVGLAKKLKSTTDLYVSSEAEKRRLNPQLPNSSSVPAIQKEIVKQDASAAVNAAAAADALVPDAQKLQQALEDFNPENLTADRILQTAKAIFPDRLGTGVWVNLLKGSIDKGATFEVWRNDKFTADALLGHVSAGAALGYQFAQAGNIAASVFAGATHPYSGVLTSGWSPVLGASIKF